MSQELLKLLKPKKETALPALMNLKNQPQQLRRFLKREKRNLIFTNLSRMLGEKQGDQKEEFLKKARITLRTKVNLSQKALNLKRKLIIDQNLLNHSLRKEMS